MALINSFNAGVTISGTDTQTMPAGNQQLVGRTSIDVFSNKTLDTTCTLNGAMVTLASGTAAQPPMTWAPGTILSVTAAHADEYGSDSGERYFTNGNATRMKYLLGYYVVTSGGVTSANTTTLDSVPQLGVSVAAYSKWYFEANMTCNSSTAAGLVWGVNGPANSLLEAFAVGSGATNFTGMRWERVNALNTRTTGAFNQIAQDGWVRIAGTLTTSGTAGTLQMQFAKTTGGTAAVYRGASMIVMKVG